jgi:hypothetical protein
MNHGSTAFEPVAILREGRPDRALPMTQETKGAHMDHERSSQLEDFKPPVKLKLSTLWAAVMFCYVYGDFFGLFVPGRLAQMNQGIIAPLGAATPGVMVGVSAMMAVPSLMVFLTLVLKTSISRWTNFAMGLAYTVIMILTLPGAPLFYLFLAAIEIALTLLIAWYALRWPRAHP